MIRLQRRKKILEGARKLENKIIVKIRNGFNLRLKILVLLVIFTKCGKNLFINEIDAN